MWTGVWEETADTGKRDNFTVQIKAVTETCLSHSHNCHKLIEYILKEFRQLVNSSSFQTTEVGKTYKNWNRGDVVQKKE